MIPAKQYRIGPETRRLTLRAFTVDDAEAFFAINSNAEVMRYTHEPLLESVEQARAAIESYPDFETVGYGRWACVLKETQSIIGFCGLKYLSDLDAVDVGYRLLPEYWGQGLATEACKASLEFGFQTLELSEIIGLVLEQNVASARVLEKSGMTLQAKISYDDLPVLRYHSSP